MILTTKIFYIVFGILTAFGGYMGYAKAGSKASLIAGASCGVLLIVAALLLGLRPNVALITGLTVSVLLVGQFLPKLFQNDFKPHIVLSSVLGLVSIILTIATWYKR